LGKSNRYRVKIPELSSAIEEILEEYGDNVTEATRKAVVKVAEIAKKETQAGANVRTGKYRAGWKVKTDETSRLRAEATVYNRSRYQLAHLLEKGHALRNGGRAPAFPHIAPAEQKAIKNMEEAIKKIAEG